MAGFKRATKQQSRLRMAIVGPSGAGKTYTALRIAEGLPGRVAVIDTERGSASKYSDEFTFDVLELETFDPRVYIDAIHDAENAGYDVLIIDSLSHAWMGKGGALEMVDKAAKRSQSGNSFTAWRDVTPLHNALVEAMLQSKLHLIVTMRAKTEYVLEEDGRGKKTPRKIGLAPVQRDGVEYEFDVVADVTLEHDLMISKTRCRALDGQIFNRPGRDVADILTRWLTDGAPAEQEAPRATFAPAADADRPASKDELRQIAAVAETNGISKDGLRLWLGQHFGTDDPREIRASQVPAILDALATATVTD